MRCSIYLAGKIKKKHEEPNQCCWSEKDLSLLACSLEASGIFPTLLNSALRSDGLSDQKSVFGRDMLQVF